MKPPSARAAEFLAEPHLGTLTTLRPEGSPDVTAVRFTWDPATGPAVLGRYLELNRAMKRAKLDRQISERISIAVKQRQGCEVCLAAHPDAARAVGWLRRRSSRRGTVRPRIRRSPQ